MTQHYDGQIIFPNPNKSLYELEDILKLAKVNFGFKYLKQPGTDEYKNYKNASQEIRRALANEKIQKKENGKCYYSKFSIEKAFRNKLYLYFMKKTDKKDEYIQKINATQNSLDEKFQSGHLNLPDGSEETNLLNHVKLGIIFDVLSKHLIDVDEEMINSDIGYFLGISGEPYQMLDDVNKIILDRISGNFSDYYSLKKNVKEKLL